MGKSGKQCKQGKPEKILFIAMMAIFAAGCGKSEKDDPVTPPPPPPPDPYEAFKADATPRWENGTTVQKNDASNFVFITDLGGNLFSSAKYKTGYMSADGSSYELIEFSGTPTVGKPAEPSIRRASGSTALSSLEIVKMDGGKLWIVFKETANSAERRIVQ